MLAQLPGLHFRSVQLQSALCLQGAVVPINVFSQSSFLPVPSRPGLEFETNYPIIIDAIIWLKMPFVQL